MRRTILIAELRDLVGGDLDFSRRRLERMLVGIGAEILEQDKVALPAAAVRQSPRPRIAGSPAGRRPCAPRRCGSDHRSNWHHAISSRPSVKARLVTEAAGKLAKNIEIVARLADRRDGLMHGEQKIIARRAADIVALERRGRRQHDIGTARGRRPPAIVHDDGVGLLPGALQPVEVLMMMERVAAGPIDQLNVGIDGAMAVELVFAVGRAQHVGDARHRNGAPRRVERRRGFPGPARRRAARRRRWSNHARRQSRRREVRCRRAWRRA